MVNSDKFFAFSPEILSFAEKSIAKTEKVFKEIDKIAEINTAKVMAAFRENRVSDGCFAGTTGYGYDDKGRDVLDQI